MKNLEKASKLQRLANLEMTIAWLEEIQTDLGITTIEEAYEVLHKSLLETKEELEG